MDPTRDPAARAPDEPAPAPDDPRRKWSLENMAAAAAGAGGGQHLARPASVRAAAGVGPGMAELREAARGKLGRMMSMAGDDRPSAPPVAAPPPDTDGRLGSDAGLFAVDGPASRRESFSVRLHSPPCAAAGV
jgi:hypothetical protein